MRKNVWAVGLILLVLVFAATTANAFGFGDIKSWVTWQGAAYLLTFILGLGIISGGILFTRIVQTLKEAGEFMTYLADALNDKKLSADELKKIVADARDVFDIWKKTPDKYIPNA